jgi:hypothetical protein
LILAETLTCWRGIGISQQILSMVSQSYLNSDRNKDNYSADDCSEEKILTTDPHTLGINQEVAAIHALS